MKAQLLRGSAVPDFSGATYRVLCRVVVVEVTTYYILVVGERLNREQVADWDAQVKRGATVEVSISGDASESSWQTEAAAAKAWRVNIASGSNYEVVAGADPVNAKATLVEPAIARSVFDESDEEFKRRARGF